MAKVSERDPRDSEMVRAFLAATSDRGLSEIGRDVPGVTHDDVWRWRRGAWSRLSAKKRRAVQDFLDHVATGKANEAELTAATDEAEWAVELGNAHLRARALHELAAAERIHAEASRIRAEAMAAQSRAVENDSDRTRKARSLEQLLVEVRDVFGDEAKPLIAAALDRLRERGTGGNAPSEEEEEEEGLNESQAQAG